MGKFEDVRERVFSFVLRIMKLCNALPKTESNRVITRQILRSSSSIGANLEEAAGGHTRSDFLHSLNISKKESRETLYWLKLIFESNDEKTKKKMILLIKESEEITKILTSSVKNTIKNKIMS